MSQIEYKAIEQFELLDLNSEHKTAVIAHCVYDNIDRAGDISRKGMFSKSWKENKAIKFLIDHDRGLVPGVVTNTYEDEKKAYTKVKFSDTTLGRDTMIEMADGIITGASFGFYTIKANKIEVKGKKVRELKEVLHDETTVAKKLLPINPIAGVVKVTKADIDALQEFKAHIERLEHFCRHTTASDEAIQNILAEVKAAKEIISSYDTAATQLANEQDASRNDNDLFHKQLLLLNMRLSS